MPVFSLQWISILACSLSQTTTTTPRQKKKNRKSNPNHSPCPSTFTHVHVQETAGWELSAANYVFDSCSRAETTQRSSRSNTKQARQRSHCVQSWRLSKSRASMLPPDWTGFWIFIVVANTLLEKDVGIRFCKLEGRGEPQPLFRGSKKSGVGWGWGGHAGEAKENGQRSPAATNVCDPTWTASRSRCFPPVALILRR